MVCMQTAECACKCKAWLRKHAKPGAECRYFMHARIGSWADKATHINHLHVTHHVDTHKDMTMKEGYSIDALYFHLPNTCIQV